LELLRELVGHLARVAVLVNPANVAATESTLRDIETAARDIGVQYRVLNADTPREIDAAFASIGRERCSADPDRLRTLLPRIGYSPIVDERHPYWRRIIPARLVLRSCLDWQT
jgi:hypothetical protein